MRRWRSIPLWAPSCSLALSLAQTLAAIDTRRRTDSFKGGRPRFVRCWRDAGWRDGDERRLDPATNAFRTPVACEGLRDEVEILRALPEHHGICAMTEIVSTPGCVYLAMELVAGVKKIIVVMEHTSKHGDPKFIPECTLPLTGTNVVDMIITDLAVFQRPDHDSPFRLVELAPGVTAEEVAEKTTAHYVTE